MVATLSQNKKACLALAAAFGLVVLGSGVFFTPLFQAGYNPRQPGPISAEALLQLDINTADQAALQSLPGLGKAKAKKIVQHRPFASVEELLDVPGITQKDLQAWQAYLQVVS